MRFFGSYGTFRDMMTSPLGPVVLAVAGIGGYYLWTAHQEHLADALLYLPLAACLSMHFFMHRGHGHAHGNDGASHGEYRPIESRHEEKP